MKKKKTIIIMYEEQDGMKLPLSLQQYLNSIHEDVEAILIKDTDYAMGSKYKRRKGFKKILLNNSIITLKVYDSMRIWRKNITYKKKNKNSDEYKFGKFQTRQYKVDVQSQRSVKKKSKGQNILLRFDPDLILSFSDKMTRMVTKAKNQLKLAYPKIVEFLPCLVLNKVLINQLVDDYMVLSETVKETLQINNIKQENIHLVGMPPYNEIITAEEKEKLKLEMGLPETNKVLLISTGNNGTNYIKDVLTYLVDAEMDKKVTILVDVGKNTGIKKYCELILKNRQDRKIYLINESDKDRLFKVADFALVAPNIYLVYECVARGLPFIGLSPISNSEQMDYTYLKSRRIMRAGETRDEMILSLDTFLLDSKREIEKIKKGQEFLIKENALEKIAAFLFEEAEKIQEEKELNRKEEDSEEILEKVAGN